MARKKTPRTITCLRILTIASAAQGGGGGGRIFLVEFTNLDVELLNILNMLTAISNFTVKNDQSTMQKIDSVLFISSVEGWCPFKIFKDDSPTG